jgi:hypothetical protein
MEEAKNNLKKNVECVDLVKEHKNRQKKSMALRIFQGIF